MPAEYKKAEWLICPASDELDAVGWPLSVVEAQASGVGVCMYNLRPDLRKLIGEAGYLFSSLDEVAEIISRPFPREKRDQGFKLACALTLARTYRN
jgi:glycosyltransferase involved in cell wall biosynthesis